MCPVQDMVPVIGTLKRSVEAVVALSYHDTALATNLDIVATIGNEKTDIGNCIVGHVEDVVVVKGVEPDSGEMFAKQFFPQLCKENAKGAICGTTLTVFELAMLRNFLQKPEPPIVTTKNPAKIEERVINNNVLKFFRSVIEDFLFTVTPGVSLLAQDK